MIIYSRVTDAEDEEITLDEAKSWIKVDGSDEDARITSLITSARRICEAYAGLSFIAQTRQVKLDKFCGDIILPYGPVSEVSSVKYYDEDDVEQTLDSSRYTIDTQSGLAKIRIDSEGWPDSNRTMNNIVVEYEAGPDLMDAIAKEATFKTIARLYEKRGDSQDGPVLTDDVIDLLDLIKVYWNAEV